MTEKRFKMKKLEYESYFIDSQQVYVDENEPNFKIDGEKTMSDSQIVDLLNENEQLKHDVRYWKQVASQYINGLHIFEQCKKYKTKYKDVHWESD